MTPVGGPAGTDNPCVECNGTGVFNGGFHYPCLGTGYRGGKEISVFLKEFQGDVVDKLTDIKEKVDEIKTVVDAL
jgi:hypothetical protein